MEETAHQARAYCGRFNLEAALRALETIWNCLDLSGPGVDSDLDCPFTEIRFGLDMGSGDVRPIVDLAPGWFRALFGGGRIQFSVHQDPSFVTAEIESMGILWRATSSAGGLPLVALDPADGMKGTATLRAHREDLWEATVKAERALVDDYGPAGILRPLPKPLNGSLPLPSAPAAPESTEGAWKAPVKVEGLPGGYLALVEDRCDECGHIIADPWRDHDSLCPNDPAED